jgi:hypothetical protein
VEVLGLLADVPRGNAFQLRRRLKEYYTRSNEVSKHDNRVESYERSALAQLGAASTDLRRIVRCCRFVLLSPASISFFAGLYTAEYAGILNHDFCMA